MIQSARTFSSSMPGTGSAEPPERDPRTHRRTGILIVIGLLSWLLLFLFVAPVNHTEAEDAYCYATDVETGRSNPQEVYHLLYLPLMRLVYSSGSFGRSFSMMILVSKLLALLTVVVLYLFLCKRLHTSRQTALVSVLTLASSYAFWRYANEAEVYMLAAFLSASFIYVLYRDPMTPWHSAALGVMGAVTILAHTLLISLVCVAAPLRYIGSKQTRSLVVYSVVLSATLLWGYSQLHPGGIERLFRQFHQSLSRPGDAEAVRIHGSNAVKAVIGFGQTVVSGNFLFSYPELRGRIAGAFPNRMMEEEVYMGSETPTLIGWVAPATLLLLTAALATVILRRFRTIRGWHPRPKDIWPLSVWFLAHAVLVTWYEPANPEMWILALIPFWAILIPWTFQLWTKRGTRLAVALIGILTLHNLVGGLLPLLRRDGDYNLNKGQWLVESTQPTDIVITLDNQVFSWYLEYNSKARIVNTYLAGVDSLEAVYTLIKSSPARIYAVNDVFEIPSYYRRSGSHAASAESFRDRIRPFFVKIVDDEFGGIYLRR